MKTYTVLVVDDEEQNIELAELILKKEGYALYFATGYEQAFEILQKQRVDVLVLDLMLPEVDGFEVLHNLRTMSQYKQLEVIVVSALNDEISKSKAFTLGASAYITKPYDIIALKSIVKERLRHATLSQMNVNTFLQQSFHEITRNLNTKQKKSCIMSFLKEYQCTLELPLIMAYLRWFSDETDTCFTWNDRSLKPLEFTLVGEPDLDCLQSCMNKILIQPYIKGLDIDTQEFYKNAPLYFTGSHSHSQT